MPFNAEKALNVIRSHIWFSMIILRDGFLRNITQFNTVWKLINMVIISNQNHWLVFWKKISAEVDPKNIEVFLQSRQYLYENRIMQFGNIYTSNEKRVGEETIQIFSFRLRNVHTLPYFLFLEFI